MSDYTQILIARGSLNYWTTSNPILGLGEFALVTDAATDALRLKIGDGVTAWNSLAYYSPAGGGGGSSVWGGITGTLSDQTDLQNALDAKLNIDGTNSMAGDFDAGDNDLIDVRNIYLTANGGLISWNNDASRITLEEAFLEWNGVNTLDWEARELRGGDWSVINKLRFASGQAIADTNGNNLIGFPATIASAVNWLQVSNSISGSPVLLEAVGSDTDVGITASTKGTGAFIFRQGGTTRLTVGTNFTSAASSNSFSGSVTHSSTTTLNGGLFIGQVQYVVATSGGTTNLPSTGQNFTTFIPAGVIATYTINMPSAPTDNRIIIINSGANGITAVTHNPAAGQTLLSPLTTLPANSWAWYKYRAADTTWYRIG